MRKKNDGSAVILAILTLSFFMVLSLSMFFISERKSRRAKVKREGNIVTNDLAGGDSIAYYELYMAEQFLRNGIPYTTGSNIKTSVHDNSDYFTTISGVTNENFTFAIPSGSTIVYTPLALGVKIDSYADYFGSSWNHVVATTRGAIITEEEIVNGKTKSRGWNTDTLSGTSIKVPLWEGTDKWQVYSIGGYRLVPGTTTGKSKGSYSGEWTVKYYKTIQTEFTTSLKYKIIVTENVKAIGINEVVRTIADMEITKLD